MTSLYGIVLKEESSSKNSRQSKKLEIAEDLLDAIVQVCERLRTESDEVRSGTTYLTSTERDIEALSLLQRLLMMVLEFIEVSDKDRMADKIRDKISKLSEAGQRRMLETFEHKGMKLKVLEKILGGFPSNTVPQQNRIYETKPLSAEKICHFYFFHKDHTQTRKQKAKKASSRGHLTFLISHLVKTFLEGNPPEDAVNLIRTHTLEYCAEVRENIESESQGNDEEFGSSQERTKTKEEQDELQQSVEQSLFHLEACVIFHTVTAKSSKEVATMEVETKALDEKETRSADDVGVTSTLEGDKPKEENANNKDIDVKKPEETLEPAKEPARTPPQKTTQETSVRLEDTISDVSEVPKNIPAGGYPNALSEYLMSNKRKEEVDLTKEANEPPKKKSNTTDSPNKKSNIRNYFSKPPSSNT
eukprot:TRINITY_DN5343_c0_g1_i1.p1 TRINITY_DN5343_c0_g1~~TRINITY_DN5343_c0_g1_i1.p1  ORF type:complete len:418 (-),score=134.75 TRINITY_DN5343_c0_g1_i1:16-1269(-)